MLKINMHGYASVANAVKAAEAWFAKHKITDPHKELKVRWWTVVPTDSGAFARFVPMLHCGDCPGGPGMFLGGPFYIVN